MIFMTEHVNGWDIIESWLKKTNKKQSDLANILQLSNSAITQIKKGVIWLSNSNLKKIIDALQLDEKSKNQLYQTIARSRLDCKTNALGIRSKAKISIDKPQNTNLPVINIQRLNNYDPAFCDIANYVKSHANNSIHYLHSEDCFGIIGTAKLAKIDFADDVIFIISNRYVEHGNLVFARTLLGEFIVGYYKKNDLECEILTLNNEKFSWNILDKVKLLAWLHPINSILPQFVLRPKHVEKNNED